MSDVANALVIIVEDDARVRDSLMTLMATADYRCRCYDSAEAFLKDAPPDQPCCVLADLNLPGIDAIGLQSILAEQQRTLPMLFFSGNADTQRVERAMQGGALNFLHKPLDPDQLLACTQRGLELSTA